MRLTSKTIEFGEIDIAELPPVTEANNGTITNAKGVGLLTVENGAWTGIGNKILGDNGKLYNIKVDINGSIYIQEI